MKSYLEKFQSAPATIVKTREKALSDEPAKPAKLGFAGFVSDPPSTLPLVFTNSLDQSSAQQTEEKLLPKEPAKPAKPSSAGFAGNPARGFQTEISTPANTPAGICPTCSGSLDLQQCEPHVSWCAGCRVFFDADGVLLPPVSVPPPLTLEDVEPQALAADLLTAGCQFIDDGEYFQIKLPNKISANLLARWEAVNSTKLRLAAASLAKLLAEEGSQSW